MQADWPILSVLVWLPIAAGLLLLILGDRNAVLARWLALAASVATFVVSVLLWRDFDPATAAMQFVERQPARGGRVALADDQQEQAGCDRQPDEHAQDGPVSLHGSAHPE
jgi:formate hydrogenlyase subunit 3/multisubunit Na+/H+ antiporter MnhD subunit